MDELLFVIPAGAPTPGPDGTFNPVEIQAWIASNGEAADAAALQAPPTLDEKVTELEAVVDVLITEVLS